MAKRSAVADLLLLYLDHRHRDPRDAHEPILFIDDTDFPNVTAFADVNGARRSDQTHTHWTSTEFLRDRPDNRGALIIRWA